MGHGSKRLVVWLSAAAVMLANTPGALACLRSQRAVSHTHTASAPDCPCCCCGHDAQEEEDAHESTVAQDQLNDDSPRPVSDGPCPPQGCSFCSVAKTLGVSSAVTVILAVEDVERDTPEISLTYAPPFCDLHTPPPKA